MWLPGILKRALRLCLRVQQGLTCMCPCARATSALDHVPPYPAISLPCPPAESMPTSASPSSHCSWSSSKPTSGGVATPNCCCSRAAVGVPALLTLPAPLPPLLAVTSPRCPSPPLPPPDAPTPTTATPLPPPVAAAAAAA
eukprot:393479-Pelagomonas_calceolata.AAC.4